jgi:hypothetical protein
LWSELSTGEKFAWGGLIAIGATPVALEVLGVAVGSAITAGDGVIVGYIGVDALGAVRYVGISGEVARRWASHWNSSSARATLEYLEVQGAAFTTRLSARIWEQSQIIRYGLQRDGGQLLNRRNEIAPKYWDKHGLKQ